MLIASQAGLVRRAQDLQDAAGAPRLATGRDAAPEAPRAASRAAVLPALAEGQYEPQPSRMTFQDFLSGLNPLQHLPVVGMIYRAVTGDVPPTAMRVAGAFLLGGPVGAVATALGATAEEIFSRTMAGDQGRGALAQSNQAPSDQAPSDRAPPTAVQSGPAQPASVAGDASFGDAAERLGRRRLASQAYARSMHAPVVPLPSPAGRPPPTRPDGAL